MVESFDPPERKTSGASRNNALLRPSLKTTEPFCSLCGRIERARPTLDILPGGDRC